VTFLGFLAPFWPPPAGKYIFLFKKGEFLRAARGGTALRAGHVLGGRQNSCMETGRVLSRRVRARSAAFCVCKQRRGGV